HAIEREIVRFDDLPVAHERGALDRVAQLAHVARPIARRELAHRLARERSRTRGVARELAEDVVREELDVVAALCERGDDDTRLRETEIEIVAELALVHHAAEIAPRRR